MIDFSVIPETDTMAMRGGKGLVKTWIQNDGSVRLMKSVLPPHTSIGIHEHTNNCEVVYVISGVATCTLDGVKEIVRPGQVHYCPKGHTHGVVNEGNEDLVVFCVVPEVR